MHPTVHRFTREELFRAVWLEPVRTLAAKLGVSDVAIAKACRAAAIPTPEVGYWMRKRKGRPARVPTLPPRPLGFKDEILIGRGRQWPWHRGLTDEELLNPIPDPPTFPESMDQVRQRATAAIKTIAVRPSGTHPSIRKLQEEDAARRERGRRSPYSSWDKPRFDSPLERRRLRILNALFLGVARAGFAPGLRNVNFEPLSFWVRVGHQQVGFELAPVREKQRRKEEQSPEPDRLRLIIPGWLNRGEARASWEDCEDSKIEDHLTEIAIELLVTGESLVREGALHSHEWRIKLKAELEERLRRERQEAERRERERLAALQQARVDRLLKEADALRMARDIRTYIEEVRRENLRSQNPYHVEDVERWAAWAHQQADAIDPVRTGDFLSTD